MATEKLIRCDLCGEYVAKENRQRFAVRRDEDRPESAEYLDVGPCCFGTEIGVLVAKAEDNRPEDADGYKT